MYNELFSIGPITVYSYGVCTALALLAALWLGTFRAKKKGMNSDICYGILFVGVIFGYFCSKLTFVLVEWKSFIQDPKIFFSQSGFVVIGGLIGGFLSAAIYCKIKKEDPIAFVDLLVPSVALAQAIGRIGCFMAGCCYGKETDSPIGVVFHHSMYAPNDVKLFPTQLISSVGDLLNMALLLLISKKTKKKGVVSACYLLFYSVGRYLVEMLRNDDRGVIGVFSTSQFFSIFSFVGGIIFMIWALKHREKEVAVSKASEGEEKNEEV